MGFWDWFTTNKNDAEKYDNENKTVLNNLTMLNQQLQMAQQQQDMQDIINAANRENIEKLRREGSGR